MTLFRPLSAAEITQLKQQGCSASDWSEISVRENFSAEKLINVGFSGKVQLGNLDGAFTLTGGISKPAGIYNATLHNCRIGNNTRVSDATISNYDIQDGCLIEQVGVLYTEGISTFGNGIEAEVINETGGREVSLNDELSVQTAYVQAFYRHRPKLISSLKAAINKYADEVSSETGAIGNSCRIVRCGSLKNIRVGDCAIIEGATRLENGTILSNSDHPAYVGDGIIADNFIIANGTRIESGAMISKSFVGQAVHLSHQFSMVNSLFFTYSQGEHGEACSAFAGPFSVTHHKSTLLIGGLYSFLNAGSGTNQSNHSYRLGPAHQGVLERGCKTGSDSYILWPSRIGAFSLIIGKHTHNADTSELPFSYLLENKRESYLMPGAMLGNVGIIRDAHKWQKRNTLSEDVRTDVINSDLFSPYTLGKIMRAVEILKDLQSKPSDLYLYKGVRIKNAALEKGIALYENAIRKHLGDSLINRLSNSAFTSLLEIKQILKSTNNEGCGEWVDIAGLLAPKEKVEAILNQIESGELHSIESVNKSWKALHSEYQSLSWNWLIDKIEQRQGKKVAVWTDEDLIYLIEDFIDAIVCFDQQLLNDAHKEFAPEIKTGFGIDGDNAVKEIDFEAVRGSFDQHSVVISIRNHVSRKKQMAEAIKIKLMNLCY